MLAALPIILFIFYLLCASTSAAIFRSWSCEEFVEDSTIGTKRAYMREDFSVECWWRSGSGAIPE